MYRFTEDKEFMSKFKTFFGGLNVESRRTGRSWLMVRNAIETSIKYSAPVYLEDHTALTFHNERALNHLLSITVPHVLAWYKEQGVIIRAENSRRGNYVECNFYLDPTSKEAYDKIEIPIFVPETYKVVEKSNRKLLLLCQ